MLYENWSYFCIVSRQPCYMKPRNGTQISEILLLILSKKPELQPLIFGLFLSMYLIIVFGNLLIMLVVSSDSRSHPQIFLPLQPVLCRHMFHFHHHPKDAVEHPDTNQNYNICKPYQSGMFFTIFAGLDGFLLAVMADDCFVTICPAALHCHHESPVLWTVHAGVLDDECPDFLVTKLNDVVGVL